MPLAEVRDKFTLSEMVIMSWRGQEQYWQMKAKTGERPRRKKEEEETDSPFVSKRTKKTIEKEKGDRVMYDDPSIDNLPDRFFNEEGEFDLSKVTGPEAVKYMNMQSRQHNLPLFPMVGGPGHGR